MPPKASKAKAAAGGKAAPKKKGANGYQLPDALPEGLVITSLKNSWRLGKSIGVGGFGEIYLASDDVSRPVSSDSAPLAVKIEPHENGPLFVEMNFYMRTAKPDMIEEYKRGRKMQLLGMPPLRGNGSHVHKGAKYRFLIMDRYGADLNKVFAGGTNTFSARTTFNLAINIIDVLEYIHHYGYVHNDVKAQNLLRGFGKANEGQVFLVDFGLVCKYQRDGVHLEYKPDPRFAHDGTIEYTSRDAHIGARARRSDLEVLAYNLLHWMSGTLPWINSISSPQKVQAEKTRYMNDIPALMQSCFGKGEQPAEIKEFLTYVSSLEFKAKPDYDRCREIFRAGLRKRKCPMDGKVEFGPEKSPVKNSAAAAKSPSPRKKPAAAAAARSPSPKKKPTAAAAGAKGKKKAAVAAEYKDSGCQTSPDFVARAKGAKLGRNEEMEQFAEKAKKAAKAVATTSSGRKRSVKSKSSEEEEDSSLANPTPAMMALMAKKNAAAALDGKKRKAATLATATSAATGESPPKRTRR